MAEHDKKSLPAYVSSKAFITFINGLRDSHVPSQIDRTVMPKASGSQISTMLASLRFLGLIDPADGVPTDSFTQLINASDAERGPILKTIIQGAYGFLFQDLDLQKATGAMVADKFRQQGISGSTLVKAVAFFLAMAKDADVKVSPHIKPPALSGGSNGKRQRRKGTAEEEFEEVETDGPQSFDPPGSQRLRLPVPGKEDVIVILPRNIEAADWEFLEPIFKAYINRIIKQ